MRKLKSSIVLAIGQNVEEDIDDDPLLISQS